MLSILRFLDHPEELIPDLMRALCRTADRCYWGRPGHTCWSERGALSCQTYLDFYSSSVVVAPIHRSSHNTRLLWAPSHPSQRKWQLPCTYLYQFSSSIRRLVTTALAARKSRQPSSSSSPWRSRMQRILECWPSRRQRRRHGTYDKLQVFLFSSLLSFSSSYFLSYIWCDAWIPKHWHRKLTTILRPSQRWWKLCSAWQAAWHRQMWSTW